MKKKNIYSAISMALVVTLTGCATGAQYRADSFSAAEVNTAKEVIPVTILAINPAKIQVDNTEGKKKAQIGGAVIAALLGGAIGSNRSIDHAISGAVTGAAVGAAAGTMVDDKILVDGVSLIFKESGKNKKPLTSAQVGRLCEFQTGDAFMYRVNPTETRIQPNNVNGCPKEND